MFVYLTDSLLSESHTVCLYGRYVSVGVWRWGVRTAGTGQHNVQVYTQCLFILQIACGLNHTLCVSMDGTSVWVFGDGEYGQLGLGNTMSKSTPNVCLSYR